MDAQLLVDNILSPPILFFALGIAATLARSDLRIPHPIPRLFALYLLWAIGLKGGVKLRESGLDADILLALAAAVVLSLATPLWVIPLLRLRFNVHDACASAAAYGSVSAVTFITAINFLEREDIPYGGHLVAALALMEAPAIIVAVAAHRVLARADDAPPTRPVEVLREAFLGGPVFLLLGSMLVGVLAGPVGFEPLKPFTTDIFYGMLVLFLLDAGMTASRRLAALRANALFAVAASVGLPLLNAAVALPIAWLLGLGEGDAFLFTILSASASYIAVPAAMRLTIPKASPGVYIPMSLALTFPFNIALGIPLYLGVIRMLW